MNCGICIYSFKEKAVDNDGKAVEVHYCRRYPPHVVGPNQSTFPLVNGERMICGEFKSNKPPQTAAPTPKRAARKEQK